MIGTGSPPAAFSAIFFAPVLLSRFYVSLFLRYFTLAEGWLPDVNETARTLGVFGLLTPLGLDTRVIIKRMRKRTRGSRKHNEETSAGTHYHRVDLLERFPPLWRPLLLWEQREFGGCFRSTHSDATHGNRGAVSFTVARVMRPGGRFSSRSSAFSLSIRWTMSNKFHDTATKKVINVTPKRYRRPVSVVVLTSIYKVKSKNLRDTAASMSV